jgi:hypothetical protein
MPAQIMIYDGEGFAVYFEVETLDGTVIPAGDFDMDDGDNKGGEDKPNAEKEGKPEEDANIPPPDGAAGDDDKRVDMQHDEKDKPSDNIDSLQLGIFSFPLNSPTKSLSVSSTRWLSMNKEAEEEGAKSAPGRVTTQRQDAQGTPAIASAEQDKTEFSLPLKPAAIEILSKMLPRQGSGAGFVGSPRSIGSTENFVASPHSPDQSTVAASSPVACGNIGSHNSSLPRKPAVTDILTKTLPR